MDDLEDSEAAGASGFLSAHFRPGRVVWAKVEGHDWWPARIVRRRAVPREVCKPYIIHFKLRCMYMYIYVYLRGKEKGPYINKSNFWSYTILLHNYNRYDFCLHRPATVISLMGRS